MSKLTRAAATAHTLSLAAMEEASRYGTRDAGIEHLLLALTLDADLGGQVLRSLGLGLDPVRAAIDEERATQLAALGVDVSHEPSRIVFHETAGYDWTPQALAVLNRANTRGRDGSSIAVLRSLLDEPSGTIDALLAQLGVTKPEVTAALDRVEHLPDTDVTGASEILRRMHDAFVPAPPAEVEAFVANPTRIPEWEPSIESIALTDGRWEGRSTSEHPDGRPVEIRDGFHRQLVEPAESEVGTTWRFSYPDAAHSNTRVVGFRCEPAAGGTQLRITLAWERAATRRPNRVRSFLLRPVFRVLMYTQLTQIASGITRAFR
ncbi:SRPBCC family protein [Microbacterium hydrocarbonoxydans]|uniref:SRPBCC family protein n=1 Tax=Microbacterium hydrocarbonoxydans TaxID=273678 RepID=UPI00203A785D|nr:SRPBCC family protein [Microbacterium hydrocarbonoxydans]MCM3778097.1 SRPBCC family protein [Microbacterium hydrocarbonoxydans]